MYEDRNGDPLAVNDQVLILGHVSETSQTEATIEVSRQGSTVNLDFRRTEPVVYTVADEVLTAEITGDMVSTDDQVCILGTVTALAPGIHAVANVSVVQDGETVTLTFYCAELIKATVTGDTITGALSNPT